MEVVGTTVLGSSHFSFHCVFRLVILCQKRFIEKSRFGCFVSRDTRGNQNIERVCKNLPMDKKSFSDEFPIVYGRSLDTWMYLEFELGRQGTVLC